MQDRHDTQERPYLHREDQRAEVMRENLKKRKHQARAREDNRQDNSALSETQSGSNVIPEAKEHEE